MTHFLKAFAPSVAVIVFCIWFGFHEYFKGRGRPKN
jgi:hypothetical protein